MEQPYRVAGRRSPAPARQLDAAWTSVVLQLREGPLSGLPTLTGGRSSGARGALEGLGLIPRRASDPALFGAGQAILVEGDALFGGSDARCDSYAAAVLTAMSGDLPELYDRAAVERLLDPGALLDRLAEAFVDLSRGRVVAPRRIQLDAGKGFSLSMPAYRPGGPFMVKIVNVFEENRSVGLPSHQAVVCVFDEDTGRCTAVLDGAAITAARTAAAAALSARLLAREDAAVLAIVGAGVQAGAHLRRAAPRARPDRDQDRRALARERRAPRRPRPEGGRGRVGGGRRPRRRPGRAVYELRDGGDRRGLGRARDACDLGRVPAPGRRAAARAGRARAALRRDAPRLRAAAGRLPSSSRGSTRRPEPSSGRCCRARGRAGRRPDEVTVYKAMGHAVEDLVAAELVVAARLDAPGPLC